jgi:hypothetical protein
LIENPESPVKEDLSHSPKYIFCTEEASNDLDVEQNDGERSENSVDDHLLTCDQFAFGLSSTDSQDPAHDETSGSE